MTAILTAKVKLFPPGSWHPVLSLATSWVCLKERPPETSKKPCLEAHPRKTSLTTRSSQVVPGDSHLCYTHPHEATPGQGIMIQLLLGEFLVVWASFSLLPRISARPGTRPPEFLLCIMNCPHQINREISLSGLRVRGVRGGVIGTAKWKLTRCQVPKWKREISSFSVNQVYGSHFTCNC